MSLTVSIENGKTVLIKIKGRFDFDVHKEFRDAYENASVSVSDPKYVVDLMETEYMDSSALGMLLLLRDHAGSDRSRVSIVNCDKVTKEVLDIANFDKLFMVESKDDH